MPTMALAARVRSGGLWGLLVMSVLVTVFSEVFYWYSGGTDFPGRVLFYMIPCTAFLWTLSNFAVAGCSGVVMAGAVYGFVTEGVLTPVMYGGFPFDPFAMSYTSLAWHALVTVGLGVVALHVLLVRSRVVAVVAVVAAFGAFWAIWATTLSLPDGPNEAAEGIVLFTGTVPVGLFTAYTVAATAVVAGCHALLGRSVVAADLVPGRTLTRVVVVLGVLYYATAVAFVVPWSLPVLGMMLWLCHAALTAVRRANPTMRLSVLEAITEPVPWPRLATLLALPITALTVYSVLHAARLSESTIRTYLLHPIVGGQTLVGWVAFIAALTAIWRRDRATPLTSR